MAIWARAARRAEMSCEICATRVGLVLDKLDRLVERLSKIERRVLIRQEEAIFRLERKVREVQEQCQANRVALNEMEVRLAALHHEGERPSKAPRRGDGSEGPAGSRQSTGREDGEG